MCWSGRRMTAVWFIGETEIELHGVSAHERAPMLGEARQEKRTGLSKTDTLSAEALS